MTPYRRVCSVEFLSLPLSPHLNNVSYINPTQYTLFILKFYRFNVKLEGKVALITGSSRGIGEAIAKEFFNEGASVIITYKKNKSLAEELNQKLKNSMIIQLDISNRQNIRNAIQNILKKHERIDILVNNAGINKPTDFEDVTDKDWDEILNTNLKGSFMISQEIFSIMKKQNYGRIINISSISGQYGVPRTVH